MLISTESMCNSTNVSLWLPDDLPERLERRLVEPLPGRKASRGVAPELSYGRHHGRPAFGARPAAVLAMIYRRSGEWRLPLVVRPAEMRAHAGQICLPGGKVEAGETADEAARREWREELGHDASRARWLGGLTPTNVYASHFAITPFVAALDEPPDFAANPSEVAEVIEVPLARLLEESGRGAHLIRRGMLTFQTPHWQWESHRVWGATHVILAELRQVLAELSPCDDRPD